MKLLLLRSLSAPKEKIKSSSAHFERRACISVIIICAGDAFSRLFVGYTHRHRRSCVIRAPAGAAAPPISGGQWLPCRRVHTGTMGGRCGRALAWASNARISREAWVRRSQALPRGGRAAGTPREQEIRRTLAGQAPPHMVCIAVHTHRRAGGCKLKKDGRSEMCARFRSVEFGVGGG